MGASRKDERIVYGATCSWWGSIYDTAKGPPPRCPHCNGVLFEVDSAAVWWAEVDQYEATGHEGYRDFIEWLRDKCYRTSNSRTGDWMLDAKADWEKERDEGSKD